MAGSNAALKPPLKPPPASSFYAQAVALAPGNVVLWNEWASLQRDALHDSTEAGRLL